MSTPTKRSLQVGTLIWRKLAAMLCQYTREPRLRAVMITHVRLANDLSKASVFFSLLDKNQLHHIQALLDRETKHIRALLSRKIKLRYTPEIKFLYDDFTEKKEKLLALIDQLPDEYDNKE